MTNFSRILIANRAEIAVRVCRTARAMGYETVAVFSDADRGALHTRVADRAVHIGPSVPAESYLSIERLIDAAKRSGADAVHPGYGFLSENPAFVEACEAAGLVFIGPPAEAMRLMASKRLAKRRMAEAGVPVVPGYDGEDQSVDTLVARATELGAPLMIKASAGGGGRGLRLVTDASQLERAIASARSEAESSFGDGELILERAIVNPRHVEIQVFADRHGHALHLYERDCSVQRRHQKVIEEAPSPAVTEAIRAKMGEAAVTAAKAIGYVGAGTVEFLLGPDGAFYFMEMNTRLQVEHPVTELVTGLDLVAWQLDVAAGRALPAEAPPISGHAIEARLYAEDPYDGFLPQVGVASRVAWPDGVRVDHGLAQGQGVTAFYDAMLAKVIAHGRDRDEARRKLVHALRRLRVDGVVTNRRYLTAILEHEVFASGGATTAFIPTHLKDAARPEPTALTWSAAALAAVRRDGDTFWRSNGWQIVPARLAWRDDVRRAWVEVKRDGVFEIRVDGFEPVTATARLDAEAIELEVDGVVRRFPVSGDGVLYVDDDGETFAFEVRPHSDAVGGGPGEDAVIAPMAGRVIEVRVAPGDAVKKNDILVILEAMKMQLELTAPRDGTVASVGVAASDQVDNKQLLVELAEDS